MGDKLFSVFIWIWMEVKSECARNNPEKSSAFDMWVHLLGEYIIDAWLVTDSLKVIVSCN